MREQNSQALFREEMKKAEQTIRNYQNKINEAIWQHTSPQAIREMMNSAYNKEYEIYEGLIKQRREAKDPEKKKELEIKLEAQARVLDEIR